MGSLKLASLVSGLLFGGASDVTVVRSTVGSFEVRERNAKGNWGKIKPLRILPSQIPTMMDAADRKVAHAETSGADLLDTLAGVAGPGKRG